MVAVVNPPLHWILASTSERRKAILSQAGFVFECMDSHVQEVKIPIPGQSLLSVAETNADLKASAIAHRYPQAYVVAADTIVLFQNRIFNKPKTLAEAKQMLQTLAGQTHQTATAVNIQYQAQRFKHAFVEISQVHFEPLTEAFIDRYLEAIQPLNKAGGYAIQHPLTQPFAQVHGSIANVVGFPIESFQAWYHGFVS